MSNLFDAIPRDEHRDLLFRLADGAVLPVNLLEIDYVADAYAPDAPCTQAYLILYNGQVFALDLAWWASMSVPVGERVPSGREGPA